MGSRDTFGIHWDNHIVTAFGRCFRLGFYFSVWLGYNFPVGLCGFGNTKWVFKGVSATPPEVGLTVQYSRKSEYFTSRCNAVWYLRLSVQSIL